jgi:hypothetical protein
VPGCFHPGKQIARGAGHDEVVVRAGQEASGTRFSTGGRRQGDDRHGLSPQGGQQAKPNKLRQDHLGKCKVGLLPPDRHERRLAIGDR